MANGINVTARTPVSVVHDDSLARAAQTLAGIIERSFAMKRARQERQAERDAAQKKGQKVTEATATSFKRTTGREAEPGERFGTPADAVTSIQMETMLEMFQQDPQLPRDYTRSAMEAAVGGIKGEEAHDALMRIQRGQYADAEAFYNTIPEEQRGEHALRLIQGATPTDTKAVLDQARLTSVVASNALHIVDDPDVEKFMQGAVGLSTGDVLGIYTLGMGRVLDADLAGQFSSDSAMFDAMARAATQISVDLGGEVSPEDLMKVWKVRSEGGTKEEIPANLRHAWNFMEMGALAIMQEKQGRAFEKNPQMIAWLDGILPLLRLVDPNSDEGIELFNSFRENVAAGFVLLEPGAQDLIAQAEAGDEEARQQVLDRLRRARNWAPSVGTIHKFWFPRWMEERRGPTPSAETGLGVDIPGAPIVNPAPSDTGPGGPGTPNTIEADQTNLLLMLLEQSGLTPEELKAMQDSLRAGGVQ